MKLLFTKIFTIYDLKENINQGTPASLLIISSVLFTVSKFHTLTGAYLICYTVDSCNSVSRNSGISCNSGQISADRFFTK